MDSGGELLSSLISHSDSSQSQLIEQKPLTGPGSGSSDDDEGFQDCEQKTPEGQGDASQRGLEASRESDGLLVGGSSAANAVEGISAPRNNNTPAAAQPTEAPPTPGTLLPDEAGNDMPIMDWEALENHIAGLQLRENEKQAREQSRNPTVAAADHLPLGRRKMDSAHRFTSWERTDNSSWQMTGFSCTTRFHSRMNLQLCFINDSSSESDTEEPASRASATSSPQGTPGEDRHAGGSLLSRRKELESEAKRGLALVKRRFDLERQQSKDAEGRGRALELSDLQEMKVTKLQNLQTSIFAQIHCLNTQLMELLETRDDLKTKQDAMLVEIGDLTH
ncbi:schwannomin-interacting protein 1-like [Cetorhinus maximus]